MSGCGDKSEKPTQNRLRTFREKGDIVRSKDLGMAASLVAGLATLSAFFPYYLQLIHGTFIALRQIASHINEHGALYEFVLLNVLVILKVLATLIPIPVVSCLANVIPGGWIFVPARLMPDFKKIDPLAGVKRLFSQQHYFEVLKTILKGGLLLSLLAFTLFHKLPALVDLENHLLTRAIVSGLQQYADIMQLFIIIIVLFAFIDVPLSHFMFIRKLRMSKKEVSEDAKNQEGIPQVKSRLRQLRRQMAQEQLSSKVSRADVVIVNPTRYAVALQYAPEKAAAPYIVAKGKDEVVLLICKVAQQHQIEIVEFPSLACSVYHSTRVNQQIPASLYRAVVHVLSYVMQLKAWRKGEGEKPRLDLPITVAENGHTVHARI